MSTRYIVGLGNPGEEHQRARHNAGFQFVDTYAKDLGAEWREDERFRCMLAESKPHELVFVKPQTFMNGSGEAVRLLLSYFEKEQLADHPEEVFSTLYVAYDDLDLELGQYKIHFSKHPKIHNGVNSIIQSLHTEAFWNLRLGTDTRAGDRTISGTDFVLQPLTADQAASLAAAISGMVKEVHAKIVSA